MAGGFLILVLALFPVSHSQPCNVTLPPTSETWRSNQTHDIHLPIVAARTCNESTNCTEEIIWETVTSVQSGDTLFIHINDSLLLSPATTTKPASTTPSYNTTTIPKVQLILVNLKDLSGFYQDLTTELPQETLAVYIVTGPAQTSCNVNDGVLLDVSPMTDGGNKILPLYDKDLTEGVNLLIIVSSLWGQQCAKVKVTVKSDNCGDGENCFGKGICYSNASLDGYECQCCPGYIGPHCEEKDACYQSPCINNGICVDISQGHAGSTFQCLCPYGFTGKICENTSDPCESGPCQHGGKCRSSNETAQQFKCDCPPGYSGPLCQHNIDACASAPCIHGICVDQEDGFRCFCQPGFTGSQCQEEYNECESSPCMNGGTCTDHIDSFSCTCSRGYTGKRCQVKLDLCDPNPCSHHHYCIDKGNSYTCECPKGFTGPDCLVPLKAACSDNPCKNGGTCWSSIDSFYCACRPGFTGKTCNEEVVFEVSPTVEDAMDLSRKNDVDDLQVPVSIPLDHLHNIYVAAGTLACAILIVVVTVVACHCRMHETYKHCCFRSSPIVSSHISKLDFVLKRTSIEKDVEPLAQSRPFPSLDNSDIYYALDFSDSQSSPLIQ